MSADVKINRLSDDEYAQNFCDLHTPLGPKQIMAESSRCLYCYDAPCIAACPTGIDIPAFIKKISQDNVKGAAQDILSANILGGTCARVCPTEELCEQACVRHDLDEEPVKIGLLQRHATDHYLEKDFYDFTRAADTGKKIAVVGAGPAGLACAHKLSELGHLVTIFDKNDYLGGLNEDGLAKYKMVDNFAQKEVEFVLKIGCFLSQYHQF